MEEELLNKNYNKLKDIDNISYFTFNGKIFYAKHFKSFNL